MTTVAEGTSRILIASDKRGDAEALVGDLRQEFAHVRASTDPAKIGEDFEAHAPNVVVLAFDGLAKAQNYCSVLERGRSSLLLGDFRTVVLCDRVEFVAAVELCRQELFDDYVLYWPEPDDRFRLAMSIRIASREVAALRAFRRRPRDLLGHARHVEELDRILQTELGSFRRQSADMTQLLATVEAGIASAMGDFSDRLCDERSSDWFEVKDREALNREIDRLKTHEIGVARRAVAAEMQAARARVRSLKDKLEPALAGSRALVDELRKLKPLVLVVDDDEFSREFVSKALDPQRWDVLFAADGLATVNHLKRVRPDVILMDIRLPGIDGVSLTHELKSSPELAHIPVIMMTGDSRKETLVSSLAAGATSYIVKPFTRAVLTEKLHKIFPL